MVDLDNFGLWPAAWWPAPSLRMPAASLLINLLTDGADRIDLAVVILIGRHLLDAAVAMLELDQLLQTAPHQLGDQLPGGAAIQ